MGSDPLQATSPHPPKFPSILSQLGTKALTAFPTLTLTLTFLLSRSPDPQKCQKWTTPDSWHLQKRASPTKFPGLGISCMDARTSCNSHDSLLRKPFPGIHLRELTCNLPLASPRSSSEFFQVVGIGGRRPKTEADPPLSWNSPFWASSGLPKQRSGRMETRQSGASPSSAF